MKGYHMHTIQPRFMPYRSEMPTMQPMMPQPMPTMTMPKLPGTEPMLTPSLQETDIQSMPTMPAPAMPGMNMPTMPMTPMPTMPEMGMQPGSVPTMPAMNKPIMPDILNSIQSIKPLENDEEMVLQKNQQGAGILPCLKDPDEYTFPQNFPAALQLIAQSVQGERSDELFYNALISMAPTQEAKDILASIRDDEKKHACLFRQIYRELTGQTLPPPTGNDFEKPASYCEGIRKALFGELSAVERYRRIVYALQSRRHLNMMTEIISDELKHSSKYNYLYSRSKCFDQ